MGAVGSSRRVGAGPWGRRRGAYTQRASARQAAETWTRARERAVSRYAPAPPAPRPRARSALGNARALGQRRALASDRRGVAFARAGVARSLAAAGGAGRVGVGA